MAKYSKRERTADFLKRNAAYFIMIFCVLATALIIVIAASTGNPVLPDPGPGDTQNPGDEIPSDNYPETFVYPVSGATLGYTYNPGEYVKLSVAKNGVYKWVVFEEMEFIAPEGTPVMAVYDGKILSVKTDIVDGTVIQIEHADGLVSIYKYLKSDTTLKAGDEVKRGDVIGAIGVSYNMQRHIGAHLCFGLKKDGVFVNPTEYFEV